MKKNRKRQVHIWLLLAMVLLLCACGKKTETKKSGFQVYYPDNNAMKLGSEEVPTPTGTLDEKVTECLERLCSKPGDLTLIQTIPDFIAIHGFRWYEEKELVVNFDSAYLEESGAVEILRRAAVVKTLCQLDGVDYVQFEVEGQPIMDSHGTAIGLMSANDFIDNTSGDEDSQQTARLSVYFADKTGEGLVEIPIEIVYDATVSIEKLVIEQLISGPYTIEGVQEDMVMPTVPEDTKLLKVSVKGNVCYVDFSEEFLNKSSDITSEVVIYSVVNSLIELPKINKVQFTIEGAQEAYYKDNLAFDMPFERNLDLVKETLR